MAINAPVISLLWVNCSRIRSAGLGTIIGGLVGLGFGLFATSLGMEMAAKIGVTSGAIVGLFIGGKVEQKTTSPTE